MHGSGDNGACITQDDIEDVVIGCYDASIDCHRPESLSPADWRNEVYFYAITNWLGKRKWVPNTLLDAVAYNWGRYCRKRWYKEKRYYSGHPITTFEDIYEDEYCKDDEIDHPIPNLEFLAILHPTDVWILNSVADGKRLVDIATTLGITKQALGEYFKTTRQRAQDAIHGKSIKYTDWRVRVLNHYWERIQGTTPTTSYRKNKQLF